jgi:hypothetical protein
MADWREVVRQHLTGLALDAAEREDVCAELAAHLEESYEGFCKQGLLEKEAARRALEQVSDWQDLQRRILNAKRRGHPMKKRTTQLWAPGFLTLTLSMIFLAVLQKLGFQPRIVWSGSAGSGSTEVLLYVPWLLSLPFFGALGAYVSSRSGGSRGTVLLASVFPVLALTAAFLLMFPIGMIVERITGNHVDFSIVATALLKNGIGWLLLPGASLLAGGVLAQFLFSRRLDSRRTAGS